MNNSVYVTATEARTGKSAVILGLVQVLSGNISKIGFFRPIINDQLGGKDNDIELMRSYFNLPQSYEESYAFTQKEAQELVRNGHYEVLRNQIYEAYETLSERYEFMIIEGADVEKGSPAFVFDINLDLAGHLGCPSLLICNGSHGTTEEIVGTTKHFLESYNKQGLELLGVLVNRVPLVDVHPLREALKKELAQPDVLMDVLPEEPLLASPTMADVYRALDSRILHGEDYLRTHISNYLVAAMQPGNFLRHLNQGSLIITPGDRSDIILAILASRHSSAFPDAAGILLTGGLDPHPNVLKLIQNWSGIPIPVLTTLTPTSLAYWELKSMFGYIDPANEQKIATAIGLFENHVDCEKMCARLVQKKSSRITPRMFEYSIIHKARQNRKRIVLPEGTEERILRAADYLARRNICDIILLGKTTKIKQRISQLGLTMEDITIIDPLKSPHFEDYVTTYYEMRKAKGYSIERARDNMADTTYFGTMMVFKGHADGMVSGAKNTTAHTIRPAFQMIKTAPGNSIVSSIFFMCLKDRILVYGDCAVNPNPTAEQLAEIAIQSAHTAKLFGIEPRVAMLSYSTGSSGSGDDVNKVKQATLLARDRDPELLIEGPIQYDAAINPEIARTKLSSDNPIAGKATVFIFPDLNTGNNTYKAVQQAANAIAMGPVLQGLRKPVNDLSRGCTIPDIINTVAITAVQAGVQAETTP